MLKTLLKFLSLKKTQIASIFHQFWYQSTIVQISINKILDLIRFSSISFIHFCLGDFLLFSLKQKPKKDEREEERKGRGKNQKEKGKIEKTKVRKKEIKHRTKKKFPFLISSQRPLCCYRGPSISYSFVAMLSPTANHPPLCK